MYRLSEMLFKFVLAFSLICVIAASFDEFISLDERASTCECGIPKKSKRIIGGSDARPNQFPWIVLTRGHVSTTSDTLVDCSGTIISNRHVVTAAHCVQGFPIVDVYTGVHKLSDLIPNTQQKVPSTKIVVHPFYNATSFVNDIALITLNKPLVFNNKIRPVCLPRRTLSVRNQLLTLAGWGQTDPNDDTSFPDTLNTVNVPVVPNYECDDYFVVTPGTICTHDPKTGKDGCVGDSGGPLMYLCNGQYTFVAIVSAGIICGHSEYPALHISVPHFLNWIISSAKGATLCVNNCYPPPIGPQIPNFIPT